MLSQDQIKKIITQAQVYGTDLADSYQKFLDENEETTKNQLKSDYYAKAEIFIHYLITNFPAPDISTEEKFQAWNTKTVKYCFGEGLPNEEWQKIIDGAFSYPPMIPLELAPVLMLRAVLSRKKCLLVKSLIPSFPKFDERYHELCVK